MINKATERAAPSSWSTTIRRARRFNQASPLDNVDVRQVSNLQEFLSGMHKLHAEYVRLGLLSPQPGDVLFSPWFFSPGNQLFVARVDQQLAGTIGFIRQSEQGMPAEKVFADVIAACGCRAEKTAEIGALCIDARYRGTGMLRTLYAWMMLYALFHQRVDTLFIQVEKRKARFYQDLLFFRQLGESRVHPDYQGREVALLHADVRAVAQTLRGAIQAGKGSGLRQLLASWQVEHLYRQLRQRLRQDTRFLWSARSMRHYCDLCGVNGERLNDSQRAMLRALLARA